MPEGDAIFPHCLAIAEPAATALLLAILGLLVAFSVMFSRTVEKLGVPVVLLFLVLGMLGGSEGIGRIKFDNYSLAMTVGTAALVLILFDGGLNTSIAAVRQSYLPAGVLATFGVAATAGFVAGLARLFGLDWTIALLLGAVVSSTDAAAVFAVLRGGGLHLQARVGRVLEVESCVNDPMAVILTTAMIDVITAGHGIGWKLLVDVPVQLAVGTGIGIVLGYLGLLLLRRVRLSTVGLYPALTMALALISFGLATLVHGSGFLAVFVSGVVLGNGRRLPYRNGLARIHDALAWLSQISMFLMLGLLVYPSRLVPIAWMGLGLGLFLSLVARPLAVVLCLLPFRFKGREVAYLSWVGLRGAVPIVLATFPVLAGVPGAERLFDIVFFIAVVSSIVPGATIRPFTRWLKLDTPERPAPSAVLEITAAHALNGELTSFFIEPLVAVCGAKLADIEFPEGAAVVMIVRGKEMAAARGRTVLQPGDHAYVFYKPQDRPFIELLFGRPEEGG